MVFEHLRNAFNLKGFVSNFIQLHQLISHVAMGHFLRSNACILGAIRPLALANPSCGIGPIVVGKVFYRQIIKTLCF
jgi:hypothetical protein